MARLREARGLPATPCRCLDGPRVFERGRCHRCGHRTHLANPLGLEGGLWLLDHQVELAREELNRTTVRQTGLLYRELIAETYWVREAAAGLIL
jgi:hypothetical protein